MPDFANFPGALGDYDRGVEYFLNLFLGVNERPQVRGRVWMPAFGHLTDDIHVPIPTYDCFHHTQHDRRSSSTTT